MSYGHRNRRTAVVIVYDPLDPSCQSVEFEMERLASGLQHEPQILVAKANVRADYGPNSTAMASFIQGVLEVQKFPSVLLYQEGAPGVMRFKSSQPLTAESLLGALNTAQKTVLPDRPELSLLGGSLQTGMPSNFYSNQQPPNTAPGATNQQPSAAPADMALPASAGQASGVAADGDNVRQPAGGVFEAVGSRSVSQQQAGQPPPPPILPHKSYWTQDKVNFWGCVAAVSVLLLIWEKWLGPYLDMKGFMKRQKTRAEGGLDAFDEDTNIDDLFRLKSLQASAGAQDLSSQALPQVPIDAQRVDAGDSSTQRKPS